MPIDPRIPLMGQQPNFLQTIGNANAIAQQQNNAQHQNAFRQFMQESGPGVFRGDRAALEGLARFDLQAAMGVRMNQENLARDRDRFDYERRTRPEPLDINAVLANPNTNPIYKKLVDRGIPPHIAGGFIANFYDESGLDPSINERNPIVPGSRGGFGLAQWTGPRREALEAFAKSRGTSPADVDTQADFLVLELMGPESDAARTIMQTETLSEAAQAILTEYLRPSEANKRRRAARYASLDQEMQRITQALASGQGTPQQRAGLETRLDYLEGEKDRIDPAGTDTRVQSSEILQDGSVVMVMTDGSRKVRSPSGVVLEGAAAAEAIEQARQRRAEYERSVYGARREGTLVAEAEGGAAAAAAGESGKQAVEAAGEAYKQARLIGTSIGNIDEALDALSRGARAGAVDRYLPSVTEASASLRNAMDRMGLDIIGAVTFGALSEGELRLAMETAVPRNLNEPQLQKWLERKRAAQQKTMDMLLDAAVFLGTPGNTLPMWIEKNRGAGGSDLPGNRGRSSQTSPSGTSRALDKIESDLRAKYPDMFEN